jgi:serine/threonine protein kinase
MSTVSPYDAIEDLLLKAMAIEEPKARRRWAQEVLQGHPEKLAELLSLTEAAQQTAWFDRPLKPVVMAIGDTQTRKGRQIGPYLLIEQIGAGGMGHVYLARQSSPVRRLVALKLLQRNPADLHAFERFRREQQVLASLEHPNIAHIFDAGSADSGDSYLAMEYVQGPQLLDHCRAQRLGIRQRVALLTQCCKAIQHAHQKGIIHRDIKPSNVLVSTIDGDPVVKVIDFGIAKAFQSDWGDSWRSGDEPGQGQSKNNVTQAGSTPGTPPFMSPEQYSETGSPIDTRSDIYSLGALLYNLLTEVPPFDTQIQETRSLSDLRHLVQQNDPVPPSVRVPEQGKVLRGDLDAIVSKAMQRDLEKRYQTVQQLTDDLRKYLENCSVSARPDTTIESLCRFASRNRLMLGAAILTTIGILAGLFVAIAQRQRAIHSERLARHQAYASEMLLASMASRDGNFEIARQLLNRYSTPRSADGSAPSQMPLDWRLLAAQLPTIPSTIASFPTKLYFGLSIASRKEIATAGKDSHLRIIDASNGSMRLDIDTKQGEINGLALHPEATQIASGGDDGTVKLWDVSTGNLIHSWKASEKQIYQLAWSQDQRFFLTAGSAKDVSVWDTRNFQLHHRLDSEGESLECLGVSFQDQVVYGSSSGVIRIADAACPERSGIRHLTFSPSRSVDVNHCSAVAFSPSGQWLAVGLDHGNLILLKKKGEQYQAFERIRFPSTASAIAFDATETKVAVGESNGSVHLLTIAALRPSYSRLAFTEHMAQEQAQFSNLAPDIKSLESMHDQLWNLVSTSDPPNARKNLPTDCDRVFLEFRKPIFNILHTDNYVREWLDETGLVNPAWNEWPEQVIYKDDGVELQFSNRWSGWSHSKELTEAGRLRSWSPHEKRVASLWWSADNELIQSVSEDGTVKGISIDSPRLRTLESNDCIDLIPANQDVVVVQHIQDYSQRVSDDQILEEQGLKLWPGNKSARRLRMPGNADYFFSVVLDSATQQSSLWRWNKIDGSFQQSLALQEIPATFDIIAAIDEHRLLVKRRLESPGRESSYELGSWDLQTQSFVWKQGTSASRIHHPSLSASGTFMAYHQDRTVELIATNSGEKKTLFQIRETDVTDLCFSHDSRFVVAVCEDHRIVCFQTHDGQLAWTLHMTVSPAFSAAWSRDQQTLICVSRDGFLKTYDIALQQLTSEFLLPSRDLMKVITSIDENWIYALDRSGTVTCFRCIPLTK